MSLWPALGLPSSELPVAPATQALPTLSTFAKIDSWALQCSTDAHGNSKKNWGRNPADREKMKWRSMITPNHCKCKNYEKHWKPPCPTVSGWNPFKPRNLKSTPIYDINTYKVVSSVWSFLAWQRSSRNLHIAKYSSSSAFMSSKFQAFKTWSRSVDLVKIHRSDFHRDTSRDTRYQTL